MIGFLAKRKRGKDSLGNYLIQYYNYEKHSFAGPLKQAVQALFGFSENQLYGDEKEKEDPFWGITPRKVMQVFGTDIVRKLFPKYLLPETGENFWIRRAEKWLQKNSRSKKLIVWTDVRYQNEVDFILQNGGIVIKIIRPELDVQDQKEDVNFSNHISEKSVDKIKNFNFTIINDGTLTQLYNKMDQIINKLWLSGELPIEMIIKK